MTQCKTKRAPVALAEGIEKTFEDVVDPHMPGLFAEKPGAQDRCQCQGDKTGDHHRHGHGDSQLVQQPAGCPAEKRDRHKHRHQRERGRDHGKRNLAGGSSGGRQRRFVQSFNVPECVLEHHDRVVDHQADRQHQRQQGQVVDGEPEQVNHQERPNDRGRDCQGRDQGGADAAQEQEDHQRHQRAGNKQGFLHLSNRAFHEHRGIVGHPDVEVGWQRVSDLRHHPSRPVRHLDNVCLGLFDHAQPDRGLAVEPRQRPLVFHAGLRQPNIAQPNRSAVTVGNHQVVEFFRAAELSLGADGKLAGLALDAASRDLHVLPA